MDRWASGAERPMVVAVLLLPLLLLLMIVVVVVVVNACTGTAAGGDNATIEDHGLDQQLDQQHPPLPL